MKSSFLSHGAPTKLIMQWQDVAYRLDDRLFIRTLNHVSIDEKGNRTIQISLQSLFLGEKEELLRIAGKAIPELGLKAHDCQEMSWVESTNYFAGHPNGVDISNHLARERSKIFFKAKSDHLTESISASGWESIWNKILTAEGFATMIVDPYGGKMDEISESETPFPHRNGTLYNIQYLVQWSIDDTKGVERRLDWIRRFYEFMTPYVSKNPRAAYLNYRDLDIGSSYKPHTSYEEGKAWGMKYHKKNYRRLALVKGKVDPENFFGNEQSIPPLLQYY